MSLLRREIDKQKACRCAMVKLLISYIIADYISPA